MSKTDLMLLFFLLAPVAIGTLLGWIMRRYRSRRSVLLLVAGNLLAFACLGSVVLALGELYYRFLHDESDALQVSLVGKRWTQRHYRYNNFDVRDSIDYASTIAPGRRRLTVIGDSFANGHGIANVEDRFANLVRRELDGWEVHLLARDGLDTGAILDGLRQRLARGYQIDCLLYAYGLNDVADLIPEWERAARRLYASRHGLMIENSYLLNTYYYRYRIATDSELRRYPDLIATRYEDPAWEEQARRLSSLAETVRQAGGTLLVASFPFLQRLDSPEFAVIHRRLADFWTDQGVPHVDLLELYQEHRDEELMVSRYDPHPNQRAHELAAGALGGFVQAACGSKMGLPEE